MLLVIIVVSSANCEIFTSWLFGKYMPSQFLFSRILRANSSTARINKEGLSGGASVFSPLISSGYTSSTN